jgi:hypothetical protein
VTLFTCSIDGCCDQVQVEARTARRAAEAAADEFYGRSAGEVFHLTRSVSAVINVAEPGGQAVLFNIYIDWSPSFFAASQEVAA